VPFILPRVSRSEQYNRLRLDGVATVLLTYIVTDIDRPDRGSQTSPMDVECESIDSQEDDDDKASMDYMEQSRSKASTRCSIDLPFDAHVLPSNGRRFCAILPLLCVTDEANINSLLSSVLYQRRVWGIVDPVVGMVFSKSSTVGQVVLGWLDPEAADDDLPTVNIARSDSDSDCNASLGVFDLTILGSAFCFAQFILGLKGHFHDIIRATSNPEIHTLGWRSDHIAIDMGKPDREELRTRVEHWTRNIVLDDSI